MRGLSACQQNRQLHKRKGITWLSRNEETDIRGTRESWGTRLHPQNTHWFIWEFPSQNKNTCRAAQKEFVILETIRGLVPKCVPQLSLGSLPETLSKDVFERRKSTGSGSFSFMGSGLAQIFGQIVSMRVKTLSNTNLVASSHMIKEEASLPVDVRRSKTPFLLTNNRPLPSSTNPHLQNEAKCITISKAEHLTSFWYRGPGELGIGLLVNSYSLSLITVPEAFAEVSSAQFLLVSKSGEFIKVTKTQDF